MTTALLLSLLLELSGASGADGVESTFRVETYSIAGGSSRELWDQIHRFGHLDPKDGKRYAAYTHWNVAWHYWYARDGGSCRIDRSTVSLDTVMTLPAWTDPMHGTSALQDEWNTFSARLKEHESGHRDNGMQAAKTIRRAIDGIGSASECGELGQRIDAAAHEAIALANQADVEYDARTRHGQTQGAVLP